MPQRIFPCETSQVEPSQVESSQSQVEWSGVESKCRVESSRVERGSNKAAVLLARVWIVAQEGSPFLTSSNTHTAITQRRSYRR